MLCLPFGLDFTVQKSLWWELAKADCTVAGRGGLFPTGPSFAFTLLVSTVLGRASGAARQAEEPEMERERKQNKRIDKHSIQTL